MKATCDTKDLIKLIDGVRKWTPGEVKLVVKHEMFNADGTRVDKYESLGAGPKFLWSFRIISTFPINGSPCIQSKDGKSLEGDATADETCLYELSSTLKKLELDEITIEINHGILSIDPAGRCRNFPCLKPKEDDGQKDMFRDVVRDASVKLKQALGPDGSVTMSTSTGKSVTMTADQAKRVGKLLKKVDEATDDQREEIARRLDELENKRSEPADTFKDAGANFQAKVEAKMTELRLMKQKSNEAREAKSAKKPQTEQTQEVGP